MCQGPALRVTTWEKNGVYAASCNASFLPTILQPPGILSNPVPRILMIGGGVIGFFVLVYACRAPRHDSPETSSVVSVSDGSFAVAVVALVTGC